MKRAGPTLLLLLSACATASPSTAPPSVAPPSAQPSSEEASASARPTPTPRPGALFEWPDGDQPAVPRALTGSEHSFMNPGAVIEHDGTLHMYANLFTAWPGNVDVYHLTSADGASWELVSEEPVMTSADVPYTPAGHDVSTGFVTDDGTWVLVFTTVSSQPWEIGLATATGPDGPWTVAPEPALVGGGAEAGEEGGLTWPSVVPTDDGWAMYFTASTGLARGGPIAMATSTDGLTWTRREEPVLVADAATWELTSLDRPRVVRTDDGYAMVYAGRTLTDRGLATSPDGITWTRVGDAPAIAQSDFPVPNSDAWDAALIHREGVLTYYLEVGFASASAGTEVYRATAPFP